MSASQVLITELCTAFGLSSASNIDLCNGVGSSSATLECDMVCSVTGGGEGRHVVLFVVLLGVGRGGTWYCL